MRPIPVLATPLTTASLTLTTGAPAIAVLTMAALVMAGCGGAASPTVTTGLTGTVVRGPIVPVCDANASCTAPFSAGFTVDRDGNAVAHFTSDTAGHFTVMLPAATYQITPDADAPLIAPATQVKSVTVQDSGLTTVTLQFDTGIR